MADNPVGITFIPSSAAAAQGPQGGPANLDNGGGSNLASAFKILSLHLPTMLGGQAIGSQNILNGGTTPNGAASVPTPAGVSPYAAIFQALLKSPLGPAIRPPDSSGLPSSTPTLDPGTGGPTLNSGDPSNPLPKFTFPAFRPLPTATGPSPDMGGGSSDQTPLRGGAGRQI